MSSGPFDIGIYEADSAEKHLIKYQPESAIFSIGGSPNVLPAGPASSPFWAKVTRAKTEYGLRPRKIKIKWLAAPPAEYGDCQTLDVVVFDPAVYNAATIGANATYLDTPAKIVGKIREDIYPET
jgi:hypothetical protein